MRTDAQIQAHRQFFERYDEPGQAWDVCFDDGFAHVTRNGVRYAFDVGFESNQEKGEKKARELAAWIDGESRAEQLKWRYWTGQNQWQVYRAGEKDGITVLLDNPPWGRCRAPFVDFIILKNGREVARESSYKDMRRVVERLKAGQKAYEYMEV